MKEARGEPAWLALPHARRESRKLHKLLGARDLALIRSSFLLGVRTSLQRGLAMWKVLINNVWLEKRSLMAVSGGCCAIMPIPFSEQTPPQVAE